MKRTTVCALLLGLLFSLSLGSCRKTLDLPGTDAERKVVLMGELVVGDSVYIRGGQSVPLSSGSDMTFRLPEGMLVTLTDGATHEVIAGVTDSLSGSLHTLLFSSALVPEAGKSYTVSALYPGYPAATATVEMPQPVNVIVVDTATVLYNADTVLRFRLRIKDDASADNYYVAECLKQYVNVVAKFFYGGVWLSVSENRSLYKQLKAVGAVPERSDTTYHRRYFRKSVYTNDNNTENAYATGLTAQQSRILLSDRNFNGQEYATDVYVHMNPSADSVKGQVMFFVKSVSADYFRFLKSYEQADGASAFISLNAPSRISSNVANGAGVIGGVSQLKITYLFDSWEK